MTQKYLKEIIDLVAKEQGYECDGAEIYIDKYNAVSFSIHGSSSGYLEVRQWEYTDDKNNGRYGRAVYSLRSISDVVQFCNIMIASAAIRARRI